MFSRLTLETLLTTSTGMSKIKNFTANLPLNGATKTSLDLDINQEVRLEFTANQHGMAFLILSSENISLLVEKVVALSPNTPQKLMASNGQYHVMHRKRSLEERLSLDDKHYIILKNTSGVIAKVAALYT